jgi:hypothetical protein
MGQFSDDLNDGSDDQPLDRVHELSWALLDDNISNEARAELENLLLSDPAARDSYALCAQLHAELASFFAPTNAAPGKSAARTPVLGFLADGFPQFNAPASDDTAK